MDFFAFREIFKDVDMLIFTLDSLFNFLGFSNFTLFFNPFNYLQECINANKLCIYVGNVISFIT